MSVHAGVLIGTLPTEQHQVTGQFHVLDSKTILIENFVYDGLGPGAKAISLIVCILYEPSFQDTFEDSVFSAARK